jgi:hypothetical protein
MALNYPPGVLIFSLPNSKALSDPAVLSGSLANGVAYRSNWAAIQPTQPAGGPTANPNDPSFNWSFFDSAIAEASAHGKLIDLRIIPQGNNAPSWLYSTGTQIYVDSGGNNIWIWWDPIAQPYYIALLQAFGARYGSNPNIKVVAAPLACITSGDWSMPTDISNWQLLNPQAPIHCPVYGASMTVIPVANSTVYVGWIVYINTFGWFKVTAITGPNSNPSTVTLQNLGIAGNASSGVIGQNKLMQVQDLNNLVGPIYNYTSAQLITACETVIQTVAHAFPHALVYLACGRNGGLDPTGGGVLPATSDADYVCAQVCADMYAALPAQYEMGKNQFKATTPTYPPGTGSNFTIYQRVPPGTIRGGQATWYIFTDPTYRMNDGTPADPLVVNQETFDVIGTYNLYHYELYQQDVLGIQNDPSYVPPPPPGKPWVGKTVVAPYCGQTQTSVINVASPPPGWEQGPRDICPMQPPTQPA